MNNILSRFRLSRPHKLQKQLSISDRKDDAGADVLNTLLEMNVGAICLGNVEASFDLPGACGQENGELAV